MKSLGFIIKGFLVLCLFAQIGCVQDDSIGKIDENIISKDTYFDFSTTQQVNLNVNYGLKDYIVLFEIYEESPVEEVQNTIVKKKDLKPLYRAATDGSGVYSGRIVIPANVKKVWLYSDFLGVISPVEIEISNQEISFDQKSFILNSRKSLRATTDNGYTYPDVYKTLGTWNLVGRPDYLTNELSMPTAKTLYMIKDVFRKDGNYKITENHKEFFDATKTSDISIIKKTKVGLVFINSSAGWNNTVGYYSYPTNQPPTNISQITQVIAFPHASNIYHNNKLKGGLVAGDEVQLKYWNEEKNVFEDEFPAGVSIGFVLEGNGFESGKILQKGYDRYSTKGLNKDGKQRTVALKDPATDRILAIGFEDNVDFDYCDATFYLNIAESGAIDDSIIPDLPETEIPDNESNSTVYYGTLAFEDLWPAQGDYDMNDVIVDYQSTVYKNIVGNKVYKIVDVFTPRKPGGSFANGFGYQLQGLKNSDIRKVTIEGPVASQYRGSNNLEQGQDMPTIILFDNNYSVSNQKFTVTIELNDLEGSMVVPPYNPFIFTDNKREKELHLINYKPTSKADLSYMNTLADITSVEKGIYYVSKDNMPFAIHLSRINDFPTPEESISLSKSYSKFESWVKSFGKQDADWYKKK